MTNNVLTLTPENSTTAYLIELIYLDEESPIINGEPNISKVVHLYNLVIASDFFSDSTYFNGKIYGNFPFVNYVDYTNLFITSNC